MKPRLICAVALLVLIVALVWPHPRKTLSTFQIHGVPNNGGDFWMPMKDDDSVGSIYECMDRIHRPYWFHRTGVCYVAPKSIRAGKHDHLELKYPGVFVGLQ